LDRNDIFGEELGDRVVDGAVETVVVAKEDVASAEAAVMLNGYIGR
jgi:hypothetical protein